MKAKFDFYQTQFPTTPSKMQLFTDVAPSIQINLFNEEQLTFVTIYSLFYTFTQNFNYIMIGVIHRFLAAMSSSSSDIVTHFVRSFVGPSVRS